MDSLGVDLRLLMACGRINTTPEEDAAIRRLLGPGLDWALFAGKAVDHGLASLVGHTLARVAPDAIPSDILDAFRVISDETAATNRALFDTIAGIIEVLAKGGIDVIPFKGPILALEAFGDLSLRAFRDLDFLVRDSDLAPTIAILETLGYERNRQLSAAQLELIHQLQGQDIIFKQDGGAPIEPHTRFTPIRMALDIDYGALWDRAQRVTLNGRTLLSLAPEDDLVVLAIHGGKEMWWNIKWGCDVAAFIRSHPSLDWGAVVARARAQGCLRMVLLATTLARSYFGAEVPDTIAAQERADRAIEPMVGRILELWQSDQRLGPPSNNALSMDRLLLHDGLARRARYVARTIFLPGPHHVAAMPLPRSLRFAYVPLKIGHDVIALPLWRAYQEILTQAERLRDALATSNLALAMMPAPAETEQSLRRYHQVRVAANSALAADPKDAGAWRRLGDAQFGLRRYQHAIACYDKALAFAPQDQSLWKRRSAAMRGMSVVQDAGDHKLDPDTTPAARAGNQARISTARAKAVWVALGLLIPLAFLSYLLIREYAGSWSAMPELPLTIETARGPVRFTVELATTKDQRERGLMFRKSLAPDAGMLFDLAIERQVALWMKNTLIPLDMVFIRANGTIVQIVANAKPLSLDNIPSNQPVRAVLEIPGGRTVELGIEPGDTVINAIFGNRPG